VRVALGRRARRAITVLLASARDVASRRVDHDRLRLTCTRASRPGAGRAVVVTTDFETGLLATVGVAPPHAVARLDVPIHSDAVVRTVGDRVYVVNRFLGDNLQVLDPGRGLATVLQCSTGPGSNPHDVAVVDAHKAYVTRYDRPELWIVDPEAASCAGFRQGSIDLGPYADADGLPEMDQMVRVADRLFVDVELLDRARGFAPAGPSALVVVDLATDTVVGTVTLSGANAFGDASGIVREPGSGKLLLAEAGNILRTGDGGIERVDPFALRSEGFVITEDELGGSVTDFVLVSPTRGYAVVIDDRLTNALVAFDLERRTARRILVRESYLPDIALGPDGLLWLADRGLPAPGIRLFDPTDDRQITGRAIDVGLPPFAMSFLP
jgi:DNA-binding beta-propeller fold protein YncE